MSLMTTSSNQYGFQSCPAIHPHTIESWHNLIDLYQAWNKSEKAKEWRAKLSQTEAVEE
jgi:hypothetical protein